MNDTVLLVDDEPQLLRSSGLALEGTGRIDVLTLTDSRQVLPLLETRAVDLIVTDLGMPHLSGQDLLKELVATHPDIPVIVMTGANDVDTAVQCMKAGAFDYLLKPVTSERLVSAVSRALELRTERVGTLQLKRAMLDAPTGPHAAFADIVTNERKILAIFRFLEALATSPRPVLITGETGTGKELLDRAIHRLSRRAGPFESINVAGMDEATFTVTLFGRVGGGYSAPAARDGRVLAAGTGTVYVEEIGELSIPSQVQLARLMRDGSFYPADADHPRQSQARFVLAASGDVVNDVATGKFRRDLYSSVKSLHVELPPLRERASDLPLLVPYFLEQEATALGKKMPNVPHQLYDLLGTYRFPGNVAELKAVCSKAMAQHKGNRLASTCFQEMIEASDSEPAPPGPAAGAAATFWFPEKLPTPEEAEHALLREAMRRVGGNNRTRAARLLRMNRQNFNRKWLELTREDERNTPAREPPL